MHVSAFEYSAHDNDYHYFVAIYYHHHVLSRLQLFYRACPFVFIHEASVIYNSINPFFSFAICASQSPRTWNETRTDEAQRVPDPMNSFV